MKIASEICPDSKKGFHSWWVSDMNELTCLACGEKQEVRPVPSLTARIQELIDELDGRPLLFQVNKAYVLEKLKALLDG